MNNKHQRQSSEGNPGGSRHSRYGIAAPFLLAGGFRLCANSRMSNPLDPGYYCSEELRSFGFKSIGENVRISKACNVVGPENIEIGDHVRIDAFATLIAIGGSITLGSYIHIGGYCHLSGRGGIDMADFSGLSQGVCLYSASDDYTGRHMTNPMVPEHLTGARIAKVSIGRHAIIGSGSVVLPGCRIADGTSVGALSLVTHSTQPWHIYSGTPARSIRERLRHPLALEQGLVDLAATG